VKRRYSVGFGIWGNLIFPKNKICQHPNSHTSDLPVLGLFLLKVYMKNGQSTFQTAQSSISAFIPPIIIYKCFPFYDWTAPTTPHNAVALSYEWEVARGKHIILSKLLSQIGTYICFDITPGALWPLYNMRIFCGMHQQIGGEKAQLDLCLPFPHPSCH
jgi:hypothetical protein